MYKNRNDYKHSIKTPQGSPLRPQYQERISDNGITTLVHVSDTNQYDQIQASLESTKIYNILRRFDGGDLDVLNQVNGIYTDISQSPTSLMEAHQRLENVEQSFGTLPIEIRKLFNHNVSEFISSITTGDGINQITAIYEKAEQLRQTQLKADEIAKGKLNDE